MYYAAVPHFTRSPWKILNYTCLRACPLIRGWIVGDIGSIRTYHTLLDRLVKVIQTPDFPQVWRTMNDALAKVLCRHVFKAATDEKTVLVKLVPIINKICDSGHESSFLYSILDPHNQIVAFSANVFETFCQ